MPPLTDWAGPEEALGLYIAEESQRTLNAYREAPNLVIADANLERETAQGGYRNRQLFELVQNSADALAPISAAGGETSDTSSAHGGGGNASANGMADVGASLTEQGGGRIEVWLVDDCLYCADDGTPIDKIGVTALLYSYMSAKRAMVQIGRFGLGFKSVLGVSDALGHPTTTWAVNNGDAAASTSRPTRWDPEIAPRCVRAVL